MRIAVTWYCWYTTTTTVVVVNLPKSIAGGWNSHHTKVYLVHTVGRTQARGEWQQPCATTRAARVQRSPKSLVFTMDVSFWHRQARELDRAQELCTILLQYLQNGGIDLSFFRQCCSESQPMLMVLICQLPFAQGKKQTVLVRREGGLLIGLCLDQGYNCADGVVVDVNFTINMTTAQKNRPKMCCWCWLLRLF